MVPYCSMSEKNVLLYFSFDPNLKVLSMVPIIILFVPDKKYT